MPHSTADPRQSPRHLSDIIGVYPNYDHDCVGMAVTQGRRCRLSTNAMNRAHASRLLDEGTRLIQLGQRNIDNILEALAPLLLCRRWHQNQAADVVREWSKKVEKDQRRSQNATTGSVTSPARSQQSGGRESLARESRELRNPSSFTTDARFSSSPYTSPEDLPDNIQVLFRLLQRVSQTAPVSPNASSRTESTGRSLSSAEPVVARNERTSNATRQSSGHSLERQRTLREAVTSSQQTIEIDRGMNPPSQSLRVASTRNTTETPTTAQQTSSQEPVASPSTTETSNRQRRQQVPTERREVVRKPIEGECHICFLSLRDIEEPAAQEEEEAEEEQPHADNTATTESVSNDPKELVWYIAPACYDIRNL
ncbi:hypothetical protein UA08_01652 [Talaromyces atroroseus]|uniref:Uncharacterized protein n=1 Tax=Talaromyces atroroseus TaxID=1441469 RepID=A0A1Q5Q9M6_TALAT|nr:hypothetical protein UA08_01652 [Talaromyces atroroseus]OKL62647.1 hypothetical protein UA08_01652 [Talaromyces atroroseus]